MDKLDGELCELAVKIDRALGHFNIADFYYPAAQSAKSLKGDFCVVRLAGGGTGLSYTLPQDQGLDQNDIELPKHSDRAIDWVQRFADPMALTPSPQRSAALATINALYNTLLRRTNTPLPSACNSFSLSDVQEGDNIGMIGFFPPLVKRLRQLNVNLTVVELRRDLERNHPGLIVTTDRSKLATCNKVLCTSTTLLNQTLAEMIDTSPNAHEFSVLGPSAGCPPDPLFALGVSHLGSAQICDDNKLWDRLIRGESLADARRKYTATKSSIPSTQSLIATL